MSKVIIIITIIIININVVIIIVIIIIIIIIIKNTMMTLPGFLPFTLSPQIQSADL